jgi:hypothetical protein
VVAGVVLAIALIRHSARRAGAEEKPPVALTTPKVMCNEPLLSDCLSPQFLERCLSSERFEVLHATRPRGGTQGAKVLTIRCEADGKTSVLRAKWRDAVQSFVNEPRRELVAYELQKLFLKPQQFVVPPVVARCLPASVYEEYIDSKEKRVHEATGCRLGFLSFWLNDVRLSSDFAQATSDGQRLFIADRFDSDRLYARKLARLNLVAVLIEHGDSHPGQFLAAEEPFRIFSVDHSISLSLIENPMVLLREDWSELIVPALPEALAARVAALSPEDVQRVAIVARLRAAGRGLVQVEGSGSAVVDSRKKYVPTKNGLLVGTTTAERAVIARQIAKVQSALSRGVLSTWADDAERANEPPRSVKP